VDWSSCDGRLASGGADDTIRVFCETTDSGRGGDAPMGAPTFEQEAVAPSAHAGDVNCVRWHPRQGGVLASAGDDGVVRVWELRGGAASSV
jgi:WD40 repeat protein